MIALTLSCLITVQCITYTQTHTHTRTCMPLARMHTFAQVSHLVRDCMSKLGNIIIISRRHTRSSWLVTCEAFGSNKGRGPRPSCQARLCLLDLLRYTKICNLIGQIHVSHTHSYVHAHNIIFTLMQSVSSRSKLSGLISLWITC